MQDTSASTSPNRAKVILQFVILAVLTGGVLVGFWLFFRSNSTEGEPTEVGAGIDAPTYDDKSFIVQLAAPLKKPGRGPVNVLDTGFAEVNELNASYGVKTIEPLTNASLKPKSPLASQIANKLQSTYVFTTDGSLPIGDVVSEYEFSEGVEMVEPNYKVEMHFAPNDALFGSQWHLNNTGQEGGTPDADIDATDAWDLQKGDSDVVIAVVDSGVHQHPDLMEKMWYNPGETPNNGVDDDNNGFVDDWHGWNFPAKNQNSFSDGVGHGTHVAGIIGANTNNATGVSGICWECKLMSVKGIDNGGTGLVSNLVPAILYAVDNGADIINNSWGKMDYSWLEHQAISYAADNGVLIISSAGNGNTDKSTFPARLEESISVGATEFKDLKQGNSNHGISVELWAPGFNIWSTMTPDPFGCIDPDHDGYTKCTGTSSSAAVVSGIAGLIKSQHPNMSARDIRWILANSGDLIDPASPKHRVNAYKALTTTPNAESYKISGFVKDQTGKPVDGVHVKLDGSGTDYTSTNKEGYYEFTQLFGRYYTVGLAYPEFYKVGITNREYNLLKSDMTNQNFYIEHAGEYETVAYPAKIGLHGNGFAVTQDKIYGVYSGPATPVAKFHMAERDLNKPGAWTTSEFDELVYPGRYAMAVNNNIVQPEVSLVYVRKQANTPNSPNVLKVARKVGNGSWQKYDVASAAHFGSVDVVYKNGRIHVSAVTKPAGGQQDTLFYAVFENGVWNKTETNLTATGNVTAIDVDNSNTPYILFKQDNHYLRLAKKEGAQWVVHSEVAIDALSKYDFTIGFDNSLHVTYEKLSPKRAVYAKYVSGAWSKEDVVLNMDNFDPTLYLGANNQPTILYGHEAQNFRVARKINNQWSTEQLFHHPMRNHGMHAVMTGNGDMHFMFVKYPQEELAYLKFTKAPSGYYVYGFVHDDKGMPLENIEVTLSQTQTMTTFTKEGGLYEFVNLTPLGSASQYTLQAKSTKYTFEPPAHSFVFDSSKSELNFTAKPGAITPPKITPTPAASAPPIRVRNN